MFSIDLGNLVGHLRLDDRQWNKAIDKASLRMKKLGKSMQKIGRSMSKRVTAPILGIGVAAVKSFANFDDAMTKSLAILGDVSAEMRAEMEKTAITISLRSTQSATDLAQAYFFLASAGLSAEQSLKALGAVEEFATAGTFNLSAATEMAVGSQEALGLSSKDAAENLKNLKRVTDNLVTANELSQATVGQFAEALTNEAAAAMKVWNIELEEGVAVLAAYAKQNIKGAEGGSAFGRMLRFMMMGARNNREEWEKFGLRLYDAQGQLRPLADTIDDMTKLLSNMSTEQKSVTLDLLGFQARSQQVILPLLGMSDSIREWNEQLVAASGHTKDLAEKNLKSFSAQMVIVWNNVKAVGREIGQILAPYLSSLAQKIKHLSRWFGSLNDETKETIVRFSLYAAAIGPALLITGKLLSTIGFITIGLKAMSVAITPVLIKLTAIFAPIAAVLGIVVLLAAAFYTLRAAWKQNVEVIKERLEALANYFKQTFDYLKDSVVGKFLIWMAGAFYDTFEQIKTGWDDFMADIYATTRSAWDWLKKVKEGVVQAWTDPSIHNAIASFRREFKAANQEWSKDFVNAWDESKGVIDDFEKRIEEGYETTVLYIKAYGEATKEHLGELADALKKQFGEDVSAVIDMINDKIKKMKDEGIDILPDEEVAELNRQIQTLLEGLDEIPEKGKYAFTSLKEHIKDAADIYQNLETVAMRAFDNTADALTEFAVTGKMQIKDLARVILTDLLNALIRVQMAKALFAMFPSLAPAPAPVPVAAAKGLAFNQGRIVPMAAGDIIAAATLLPLMNQRTALVGERGPEAVMPLTRTQGGELGVRSIEPKFENRLKIVNVMSQEEYLAAMRSDAGEKVILNTLRRNGVI